MERREEEAPGLEARIEALALGRREQAESLQLYDANAWLGEPAGFPLAREMEVPALGQALRDYGIRSALVSHWAGLRVAPQAGNRALAEALGESGRSGGLRAIWTGLPLIPRE
jgi:hypothetical protein